MSGGAHSCKVQNSLPYYWVVLAQKTWSRDFLSSFKSFGPPDFVQGSFNKPKSKLFFLDSNLPILGFYCSECSDSHSIRHSCFSPELPVVYLLQVAISIITYVMRQLYVECRHTRQQAALGWKKNSYSIISDVVIKTIILDFLASIYISGPADFKIWVSKFR